MSSNESSRLKWIENIASLMDDKFLLPGTKFRFGLDPILGLIPFIGELSTFVISAGLLLTIAKHGASRKVIILMMLNVMLDSIIGSIPLIGNIFDFAYRANRRNVTLLKKHYTEGKYQGSGTGILWTIAIALLVFFFLLIYVLWKIIEYAFSLW